MPSNGYTDGELATMMVDLESDLVERKRSLSSSAAEKISRRPTVRQASDGDEQRLAERRRATDLPFDLRPAYETTIADLDLDYIRHHYLPMAVSAEVLD